MFGVDLERGRRESSLDRLRQAGHAMRGNLGNEHTASASGREKVSPHGVPGLAGTLTSMKLSPPWVVTRVSRRGNAAR